MEENESRGAAFPAGAIPPARFSRERHEEIVREPFGHREAEADRASVTATKGGRWDVAVVGGGIVGLAAARALCVERNLRVVVLEAESKIASHQSGRNSGVIHAGLYYRPGSLKSRLCTAGRKALYDYCESREVPHRRCGKLVVATTVAEASALDGLERRGRANGLERLERLDESRLKTLEPAAAGVAGLWVPQTGVVDYSRVAEAFAQDLLRREGEVLTGARVVGVQQSSEEVLAETTAGEVRCARLVNCAGLESDRVARLTGLEPELMILPIRGEYYRLRDERRDLVRGLIYPVPNPTLPFLGVHFTRTISGEVLAGPGAMPALSRRGYRRRDISMADLSEMARFAGSWRLASRLWRVAATEMWRSLSRRSYLAEARRLVPALTAGDLEPAPSGVRAQAIDRRGELIDDFRFAAHGRTFHVLNAPSPAATAALAIAREIASRVAG